MLRAERSAPPTHSDIRGNASYFVSTWGGALRFVAHWLPSKSFHQDGPDYDGASQANEA